MSSRDTASALVLDTASALVLDTASALVLDTASALVPTDEFWGNHIYVRGKGNDLGLLYQYSGQNFG